MAGGASFHQILEEKMRGTTPDEKPSTMTETDPAHLAYLLGNLGRTSWKPAQARIYPAPPRPAPRPHSLTFDQQCAFEFFNSVRPGEVLLTAAFTRRELKKAFRLLALRLHPDMNNGASAPFIDLKNHFERLSALFN